MTSNLKDFLKRNYTSILALFISLAALLIYYVISFPFGGDNQSRPVRIYYADNISNAHKILIDNFNKRNSEKIEVVPIDLPFTKFSTNERKELMARSMRSTSGRIDIVAVDIIWVPRFEKWCLPLDIYFPDSIQNKFLSYALESCTVNGKLSAIPFYLDISLMYYRDDLFKKNPDYISIEEKLDESITWQEFLSLSEYYTNLENPFYTFQADDYEGLICSYFELILGQDKQFFSNTDFSMNSEIPRKSLQLLVDFVNRYKISPPEVSDFKENTSYSYFLDNNGIFLRGWPSFEKDYKNLQHDSLKEINIKKTALPHLAGTEAGSVYGGWNLMISKFTNHQDEVIKFIRYLVSEEAQEIMYKHGAYLPVRKIFYESNDYFNRYDDLVFMKKLLDRGYHRPFLEDYTRISDIVSYYVNKAISQEISIDTALEEVDKLIKSGQVIIK
ncbi:extracellular solute-binding protein [Bacteroidota bacterium]